MIASSQILNVLAWSLLHFLWQGAAIAALAGAWMAVLRRPATRYLLGIGALALMLVCFGTTFAALSAESASLDPPAARAPAAVLLSPLDTVASAGAIPPGSQAATSSSDVFAWIAWGWLAGVACFALRIVFGLLVLERLRRRSLVELPARLRARLRELQERLGIRRAIRYCQCDLVSVPAVIGFFRPIVLLPVRALTGLSAEQLEAVIAHELGHVQRFDVVVNFAQVIAETLLFFHPAVWWLNKRIRAEREDCCDDVAVAACGSRVTYARALAVMEDWRVTPQFAMAVTGGSVAARVARLLGIHRRTEGGAARAIAASLVLIVTLVAGAAALGFSPAAWAQSIAFDNGWKAADLDEAAIPANAAELATQAALASGAQLAHAAAPTPAADPRVATQATPAVEPATPAPPAKPPRGAAPKPPLPATPRVAAPKPPVPKVNPSVKVDVHVQTDTSFIEELKAQNLVDAGNIDVDTVVGLKVVGVTTAYIEAMSAAGVKADASDLVAMKTQNITPEYVQQMRATGLDVDTGDLIAMKVQDITPQYVKALRDLGIDGDANSFVAMRVQDITPEYVHEMRDAGLKPDADELIALKVQDVTPKFMRDMKSAGIALDANSAIQARVFDISPEDVAKLRDHGFKNLTLEKLVALKNADVL